MQQAGLQLFEGGNIRHYRKGTFIGAIGVIDQQDGNDTGGK
jgi:hypothetical protein